MPESRYRDLTGFRYEIKFQVKNLVPIRSTVDAVEQSIMTLETRVRMAVSVLETGIPFHSSKNVGRRRGEIVEDEER